MQNSKGNGEDEKTEPKENDKWMENNDHEKDLTPKNSRVDEWRGRAKKFASNRYHLIIVLLCILLFILFIIVIVLAVQLGTYSCPVSFECRTAECLGTAAAVVERSDTSLDPCDDFWAYSCNGWKARNSLPKNRGSFSVIDQLKMNTHSKIRHLIDLVPHDSDSAAPERKVRSFYDSCRDLKEIEHWVPTKIKQAIHEIGGWAIINDSPSHLWRRNDVLKMLQVSYGVEPFFKVLVEADDRNPMRNIIKYVVAYKEFIMNTIQTMDVNLFDARRFAEEVFNYERRIAEIFPTPETLRNTKDLYTVLTLERLDQLSHSISWTEILQMYFPNVVTPDTEVAVLSQDYFNKISEIISSTDDTVLNNYYMWRLMHTFAPYSSSKFRLVANKFKQTFEGTMDLGLRYEDNWEACIEMTSKFLGHAIGAMYVQHYFPQSKFDKIHVYLNKLIGALSEVARHIPWLNDEEMREQAQMKIRSLGLFAGYPNFIRNHTTAYYKELKVQAEYFQNIKDGVYFLHKKQEEMLKNKALSDYSWTVYPQEASAVYKYTGNQLIVPAGLFDTPLFDPDAPLAVKYGVLAAHVANKLAEVFDDKGINYDAYGTLRQWVSNNSVVSFSNKQSCLKKILSNYTLEGVNAMPELTIGSLIADIGGVKIAYEAYRRHAEEEKEMLELPGLGNNNQQLFFISYAQSLCQIIKPEKLMSLQDSSMQLPEELRVLGTLQQLSEFSSVFSCSRSSPMNSKQLCNVW
ncbi:Endothelin-converting enzyme 2 like protein [Argiope bruennichi]|uniref:Endothelin-converting enzyme 2 like protein n=1 Tax=Argiope bruennichi TaxID=94029 RepID=A0A8T0FQP7_ARGBR|nr:Endothelin-converting enzyme 2 like protein [Argiope bruennichi]